MDNFDFWWYVIAAVIYFLTRGKKKKANQQSKSRPGTENTPKTQPKSFEELLKEITEGKSIDDPSENQKPIIIEDSSKHDVIEEEVIDTRKTAERAFADDESKRVYEDSIKMAEGADLKFEPYEHFETPSLLKSRHNEEDEEWSIADDIRDGLQSSEARKAVIYSEILTRKFF